MALAEPRTISVLGLPLAVTDYARAVDLAVQIASAREAPYGIEAANTHVAALARHDSTFGEAMRQFDLILPDGMPLIWCLNRQLAQPLTDRVYGPTFMLKTLAATEGKCRHFLLGGSEELLSSLSAKLLEQFPNLELAGVWAPPFGEWPIQEDEKIMAAIADSGAHFVWIGLGCPKQEFWIAKWKQRLPPAVYVAVGAAFAFHAGRVKQAPPWMQRLGLEWAFRLLTEPRRLWRRYFVFNSLFLFYLLADGLRGRSRTGA